jgi:type I restriction enzyme S subunit
MSFEWTLKRLGDCCEKIGSGSTPRGGKETYLDDGPVKLIRSQNVHNDGFSKSGLAFISIEQAEKLSNVSVQEGDVLLNITGDSVARVCQASKELLPARVNQHVAIIRPKATDIDANFLRYFLASPLQQNLMLGLASAGATRNALTKGMIEAFQIPCPPVSLQHSIANVLSILDDRITLLRESNVTLEAVAQALFKSWFVDFDPVRAKSEGILPEGIDEATAALFPDAFTKSELGLVPSGWQILPFLDTCDLQGGSQPPASVFINELREGHVRLLQIRDFSSDAHTTYIPDTAKLKKVSEDDVLIGRYGSASGDKAKDSLGRVCRGLSGAYNVALMKLNPLLVGREFAFQLVSDPRFYNYLQGVSSKAVQSGFSKSELAQYKIVLPNSALIERYEQFGVDFWISIKTNNERIKTLKSLRDTLIPRLILGQLRLPELNEINTKTKVNA